MHKRFSILLIFIFSVLFSNLLSAEQNIFIFIGAPGAGKGTLSKKLSETTHLPHISTGDLLRAKTIQEDELSKELNKILATGQLVPDDLIISILLERVQYPDCSNGFILDGFPRTLTQAKKLEESFPQKDHIIVVNVSVSDNAILERLQGRRICKSCSKSYHIKFNPPQVKNQCDDCAAELISRQDDTAETIQKRLEIYKAQFNPIKRFYKENYQWIDVKNESAEKCFASLLNKVEAIDSEFIQDFNKL